MAGGQLGPIARDESRQQVVSRLLELMREAKACGSDLVVFPELALTSFFPRWWMEDEAEINSFFEREMPAPATRPLFEAAKSLGIGFHLGYAELAQQNGVAHRYNTAILSSANIARCVCQATPTTGRTIRFSIWRNAISSRAIWAFRCGAPSAATSACASATIAAGRRPIASWECKESS